MTPERRLALDAQDLLDRAPVIMWASGPDGGCTYVNQYALDFTGMSYQSGLGDGWSDSVHPEDRPRALADYREAFEARRPIEFEYRLRRHDGEYRHVVSRAVAIYGKDGEFAGYIGRCIDVTEARDAERRVQRGLELFQSALDGLCCHIAVLDREGCIRVVNRAWRRFAEECALPLPDAGVGASYLRICEESRGENAAEAPQVASGIRDLLAGRGETFQIQYPCHGPDQERWFLLRASPLRGSCDTAVVLEHIDVTALRLAERERALYEKRVRESQRLESLGILAGGLAHDFNNLLTVILGNSRVVFDDLDKESPLRARLARVRSAAEQAARLTGQMLTYAGQGAVALELVSLSRVVENMRLLLESCLEGGRLLELHPDERLPVVEADPGQMRQVVLNLVVNAAESMEGREGAVAVRTSTMFADAADLAESFGSRDLAPGEYVVLEVTDCGRGIDPEQRSRLFEPFFSTKSHGRGLGLSVVLGIVRAHGGAVQVSSEPGHGTTFRVLLPPSPRALERSRRATPEPSKPTILVVDDDDDVREIAMAFLERSGFDVISANSGHKAIETLRARSGEIAAVVLDLAMPELNGASTAAELRRIRPRMPILLISGFNEEQAQERFPKLDSAGLLQKPFEPEALVERLRALLAACPFR